MAENDNGNSSSSSSKILWWILGGFAGLAFLGLQLVLGRIDTIDSRQREDGLAITKLEAQVVQLEALATLVRADQMSRVIAIAEIQSKLTNQDLSLKLIDERTKVMTERILSLAQRLDRVGTAPHEWSPPGSDLPH